MPLNLLKLLPPKYQLNSLMNKKNNKPKTSHIIRGIKLSQMKHVFDTPNYKPKNNYEGSIYSTEMINQLMSPFDPSFIEKNIFIKKFNSSCEEERQEYEEYHMYENNDRESKVIKTSNKGKKDHFEPKRCRGRPKKQKSTQADIQHPKKKRGRPKKVKQENEHNSTSIKNPKKAIRMLPCQKKSSINFSLDDEAEKKKVIKVFQEQEEQEEDEENQKDTQILKMENLTNQIKTISKKPRKKQNGFIKQVTIQLISILMHFPNGGNLKQVAQLVYQMYHKQQADKEQCHKQFLNIKRRIYQIAKILHHIGMLQKVSKTEQEKYKSNFMIDMDMLTHNIRKLVICHINNSKYSFIIKVIKEIVMLSTQLFSSTTQKQIIVFRYNHSGMHVLINQAKDSLKILQKQGNQFICLKTFDLVPFIQMHCQEIQNKKCTKAHHKELKQYAMLSQIQEQSFQQSLLHEQNQWQSTYVKIQQSMSDQSSINEGEMFNESDYEVLKIDQKQQQETFAKFKNLQFNFKWNSQPIKNPQQHTAKLQQSFNGPKMQIPEQLPKIEQLSYFQRSFSIESSNSENQNPTQRQQSIYDTQMQMDIEQLQLHSVNSVSSHQQESNTPHSIGSTRQTLFFPNLQVNYWDKNYFR